MFDPSTLTFGCEHEFSDWDRSKALPQGFTVDTNDITIVNSNGVAADPKAKLYGYGGEVQTPPSATPAGQVDFLKMWLTEFPETAVNYRANLHVHIRVPGLAESLPALKQLQKFNQQWLAQILPLVDPLVPPDLKNMTLEDKARGTTQGEYLKGAARRYRRNQVSRHTCLAQARIEQQLAAPNIRSFFEREVPFSKTYQPLWHCQPRAAVNVRQLKQTDTIEFRHFQGTLDPERLMDAIMWCRGYLLCALQEGTNPITELWDYYPHWMLPKAEYYPYQHWLEVRYRATCHDGTNKPEDILKNIWLIQNGKFNYVPH